MPACWLDSRHSMSCVVVKFTPKLLSPMDRLHAVLDTGGAIGIDGIWASSQLIVIQAHPRKGATVNQAYNLCFFICTNKVIKVVQTSNRP